MHVHKYAHRPGDESTDNHLFEFSAEVPQWLKTQFVYEKAIGMPSHILGQNTWKLDIINWLLRLPLCSPVTKIWKYERLR